MFAINIDEPIILPENLPPALLRDSEELREYYNKGDWFFFDNLFDVVAGSIKGYYHNGKSSRDDFNQIFRKYGVL